MRRRDALKLMGFSGAVLGSGGVVGYLSAKEDIECYEELEEEEFYDLLGSHEGDDVYDERYDLTDSGSIGDADLEVYRAYESSDYKPLDSVLCEVGR